MKLETYIIKSILRYPSLYYKPIFEESVRSVLNHLFLVIGGGVEFNPKDGSFVSNDNRRGIRKGERQRIKNGEQLVVVSKIDKNTYKYGMVFPDRNPNFKEEVMFLKDFLSKKIPHYHWGEKIGKGNEPKFQTVIEIYPNTKEEKLDVWSPYPFSIKYCSFWDEQNRCLIPKNKIADDWRIGIVKIFTEAKKWFEDDEKWGKNNHYNWAGFWKPRDNDVFLNEWNKHTDKLKVCDAYEIPRKKYLTPKEMAIDICKFRRERYIKECEMVIKFYE